MIEFKQRAKALFAQYEAHVSLKNTPEPLSNGIFKRWQNPVVTREHAPVHWRYDLNPATNPLLLERLGVNAAFNAGAMLFNGKYCVMLRVEGADRKSFFAVAESDNGVDNFRFWDEPVVIPETSDPDTNTYDMRLVSHEDGWIYGLFCAERKDKTQPNDMSAAEAQCGIARTKDLKHWERLPDLMTYSGQQRNVVLHPEFIDGQYALYTRPQDGFISVGAGGGIGWGLTQSMVNAEVKKETIVDHKVYHSIKEVKNGQGPAPIKTEAGWLHLAHGVRNTAAGLRYVLYCFMTDLQEPWRVVYAPGGYLLAPQGSERVGDVSNVVFSNGWVVNDKNEVFIYYASSDTRLHVATSSVERLVDYCKNTPPDSLTSFEAVKQRLSLIDANKPFLAEYL